MTKVTRAPVAKMFGGKKYSIEASYPQIPAYPSTKPIANRVAAQYRKGGYSARVASFNIVVVGGKYPVRKTVWYVYTR